MSNLLTKAICLKLNASWQRTGWMTAQQAIVAMCGKPGGTQPALALDIALNPDGSLATAIPTKWDDWIRLPVRKGDLGLNTSRGTIRCPTVVIDANFNEMPLRKPKLSSLAILERDNYIDQYTGEKLQPHEANVDHVIPRDTWKKRGLKGSPDNWGNMVCCRKERNFRKGNKTNGSLGLVLIRRPREPKLVPASFLITKPKHPHHTPFITC